MKHTILKAGIAALLAMALLSGCVRPDESTPQFSASMPTQPAPQEADDPGVLRVAYSGGDTLNPYTTQSLQNFYVCGLLYDPLVKLDSSYTPNNYLAESVAIEGNLCTVRLRGDIRFWDGTALSAADAAYSLSLAMQSGYYAAGLSHITAVAEDPDDPLELTLELSRPDAFIASSLTFPIIRSGSGEQNMPVGSGRFSPASSARLEPSTDHWERVETFEAVELVAVSDADALSYSVKIGTIDYMFSDLSGDWNRSLGNSYSLVQLSNLIYLGANNGQGLMANATLRGILSDALDRSALLDQAYATFGQTTRLPLNPAVSALPYSVPVIPGETPAQRLDAAGYYERDDNGYRTDAYARKRMSLRILVNDENASRTALAERIARICEDLGIQATVDERSFAEYQLALQNGDYDLYIGEVKLPYNMDVSSLFSGTSLASSGCYPSQVLLDAAWTFLSTGQSFDAFEQQFLAETPMIPLFYRRGIVTYPLNFSSNIVATEQDIFYNIQEWNLS